MGMVPATLRRLGTSLHVGGDESVEVAATAR